jgi:methylated-DNA-[protein]-cysteine S-methyltransferase
MSRTERTTPRATRVETARVPSPVGPLHVFAVGGRLSALDFDDRADEARRRLVARLGAVTWVPAADPAGAVSALRRYLAGEVDALARVPVHAGGTPFQARVWAALRAIPAGATASYGEVARASGAPTAVRAVGAANGRNGIALVIPCHRVIAKDGGLHGYAGGLERKRWLLSHEGARC